MSFAVMSSYKYINKRLYDESFILYIQIKNNMEMYWGVSTWHLPPPLSFAMPKDQKSEKHLIAKFSQLVKMKEIYLRCY